ncbi:hypothetical protein MPOCJGCO_4554 [Methylobacterium trifolii]|uniref:Uncharacterized protein n=1 Tax=Methylobacterium trifolii TaxID=1003092 RepID=A0ABQ4U6J7_9HYPH|nr:hypothetical protein MPOCJGCO_4554 [Methylobacterium trifolii]
MAIRAMAAMASPIEATPRPRGTTVISTTSFGPTSVLLQVARSRAVRLQGR